MKKVIGFIIIIFLIGLTAVAAAQPTAAQLEEFRNALQEAQKAQQMGPTEVMLADQAKVKLPQGYLYVPQPQAGRLMRAMGNRDNPAWIGLILPQADDWMVVVKYQNEGHIKDDDAKNWNVDELFASIKEGTEEANKERKERGFPESEIIGWVEKPKYNETKKQLVWSISSRQKGDVSADPSRQTINYNTYALGREGYLTLTLITSLQDIEARKPIAAELLAATEFVSGKRYDDFNSSTDKIAEYGLAALIAGAAAKKVGLFALLAGGILKFGKIIGLAVIAGGAVLAKLFRRKKKDVPQPPAPPAPPEA